MLSDRIKTNFVLVATYNGECFIEDQIVSIIQQDWDSQVWIIIRDDGSTDKTVTICERLRQEHQSQNVFIEIIKGKNVGLVENFLVLCRYIKPKDNDLIFFSDQDDVWEKSRVKEICFLLKGVDGPSILCGALNVVNSNLELQYIMSHCLGRSESLYMPLIGNFVTGCSLVINARAWAEMDFSVESKAIMHHDWWIGLQAFFYGFEIIYQKTPSVLYRQHGQNVTGAPSWMKLVNPLTFFKRSQGIKRIGQALLIDQTKIPSKDKKALLLSFRSSYYNWIDRIRFCYKYREFLSIKNMFSFIVFK